jgi:phosphate transport system substrate-binding protein
MLCAAMLAFALAACGSSSEDTSNASKKALPPLNGAGSALMKPLMERWQSDYEAETGEKVTYRTVKNGLNLRPVAFEKTDFGVSDAPITPVQFGEGTLLVMLPWALTGMVIVYNVDGVPPGIHLSPDVLGGIYLGEVDSWDDPAIGALNPGVQLPSTPVTPVVRRDESGEDYVLTNYLVEYENSHQEDFGITRKVILTTKTGKVTKGSIASDLAKTNGSIGIMPLPYARNQGLDIALLENPAGEFPVPNTKSLLAGAEDGIRIGPNNEVWADELPTSAKGAYPLVTFSYAAVPSYPKRESVKKQLKDFVTYAISPAGQADVESLGFAPLPEKIIAADKRTMRNIFP